jgi:hypothetical protein
VNLPPQRYSRSGKPLASPRLELSLGPDADEGSFIGPFRNETLAENTRRLAREVFDLDVLRRSDPFLYAERLQQAWAFLKGDTSLAEVLARRSVALLRRVVAFELHNLLLPADPRHARYVVVRPVIGRGIEGIRLEAGVVAAVAVLEDDDAARFAQRLLEETQPRTSQDDRHVVLRWFGAQRPPAHLVHLPPDALLAADAVEVAALELLETRAASGQDPLESLV